MKLACVIHRYGPEIVGGSESHCRSLAERLAERHDVEVLTSCARDYVTWRNVYPAGWSQAGPVRIRRFPVARQRRLHRFAEISELVFSDHASLEEQRLYFRENGPEMPELLGYLAEHGAKYDRVLFWSYRYYPSFFGVPIVADRAILVPTAEEDPLIRASILGPFFALPRGFLFLTPEEADLIAGRSARALPPSCVIGGGLEPATERSDTCLLADRGIGGAFAVYLGRIERNKGCETLLRYFLRFLAEGGPGVQLVMAGPVLMELPDHPSIIRLGIVDEALRAALLSAARLIVIPSPFESLSLALLEAWNHRLPALVNGRCKVLKGQVARADGGLYYGHIDEFAECLRFLLTEPETARRLGEQGLAYVNREYRWPTVMKKVEDLLRL